MIVQIFSKTVISVGFLLPMFIVLSGKIDDKARTKETGSPSSASKQVVASTARFRALVLAENGGHHIEYSKVARPWLDKLAADSNFLIDHIITTDSIDDEYLKKYQLFIQLDYPPYAWKDKAVKAFEKYITEGRGGWIGFHHATLLGEFDGYPMWEWFFHFMGEIKFKDYIAGFAAGNVKVEDLSHPVTNGIPSTFLIKKEEWYTYDKSPTGKCSCHRQCR